MMMGRTRYNTDRDICRNGGFTLLELLVVLVILSGAAFMTLNILTDGSGQVRFDDTKNRLKMIRRAVAGDVMLSVNGEPMLSGFVADVGRLPNCMQELLVRTDIDCDSDGTLEADIPDWQVDDVVTGVSQTGLSSGWRGPYLKTFDGVFRDGWGNEDSGANNYGWNFTHVVEDSKNVALTLQSLGLGGAGGTSAPAVDFEEDYPAIGNLIERNDIFVDVSTVGVSVILRNTTTSDISLLADTLCLRVFSPDGTVTGTISDIDDQVVTQGNVAILVTAGGSVPVTFSRPATSDYTSASDRFIPIGNRMMRLMTYNSGTGICTTTEYSSSPYFPVKLMPSQDLPTIVWNLP